MDCARICLVRTNAAAIGCQAFELADVFLQKLWRLSLDLRRIFSGEHARQRRELIHWFSFVSKNLADVDAIAHQLGETGRVLTERGVTRSHCLLAKDALLAGLKEINGSRWTSDLGEAWARALNDVFDAMAPTTAAEPALSLAA
jgi:hemoglobin-like flavoprotein